MSRFITDDYKVSVQNVFTKALVGVETSSGHVLAAKVSSLPFKVGKAAGGRTMSRKEV